MIHAAVVYDSQSSSLKGALTAIRNLVKYTVAFALWYPTEIDHFRACILDIIEQSIDSSRKPF